MPAQLTYTEERQRVLLKASRDMRAVAILILDDVQNDVELKSAATLNWTVAQSRKTALMARDLENLAYEQGAIYDNRIHALITRSRNAHSDAIARLENRVAAVNGDLRLLDAAREHAEREVPANRASSALTS